MKVRYQIVTQIEIDTDTGKSRVLKQFSSILGQGNTMKKPKVKNLTSTNQTQEYSL